MNARLQQLQKQTAGLVLACCMAAMSAATEPTSPQTARSTDARQQLLELEKEWTAAEEKHDATALRRILDERFVATFDAEKTFDKETFIGLFAGDVDPSISEALTYQAVIIDGDTAVLVGTDTAHGTRGGLAYTAVYKYTVTYIRRHGRWRALAEHVVEVPEAR